MTSPENHISRKYFIIKQAILISSICSIFIMGGMAMADSVGNIFLKAGIPPKAVIAHRGASWYAPEETEPAYIIARETGADYLECDIQLTSDGVPVLFHDDTLERTTDVAEKFPARKTGAVSAFTLAEIKALDAGSWFNMKYPDRARSSFKGLAVLTLDEFVKVASSGRPGQRLYIESKSPEMNPGVEEKIVAALKASGWLDKNKVVFQSFSIESLNRFRELAPDISRVYLVDEKMEKASGWDGIVKDAAAAGNAVGPVGYIAWPWNIKKAHKMGLIVHVYTIDAMWQARLVNFFGADGIFTDRCDMLLNNYKRDAKENPSDILIKSGYQP